MQENEKWKGEYLPGVKLKSNNAVTAILQAIAVFFTRRRSLFFALQLPLFYRNPDESALVEWRGRLFFIKQNILRGICCQTL